MFLGAIGLSFVVIYLVHRELLVGDHPVGVLLTLAVMIPVISAFPGAPMLGPALLFFGLGATFAGVPAALEKERRNWALYPAGILAVIGVMLLLSLGNLINILWAAALIVGGGIWCCARSDSRGRHPARSVPITADRAGRPARRHYTMRCT